MRVAHRLGRTHQPDLLQARRRISQKQIAARRRNGRRSVRLFRERAVQEWKIAKAEVSLVASPSSKEVSTRHGVEVSIARLLDRGAEGGGGGGRLGRSRLISTDARHNITVRAWGATRVWCSLIESASESRGIRGSVRVPFVGCYVEVRGI